MIKTIQLSPTINAYIKYEERNNKFTVLSTYVDDSLRGQGIAKQLYNKFISLVKENNGTFCSRCSYITKIASSDGDVKNLFVF